MAKKKLGNPGSPPKPRRPTGYWRVFNAWWRDRLESTGRRPTVEEMTTWYRSNALLVWGPKDLPPIEDMKQLSKGMRSTKNVRAYFQEYRAAKKMRAQSEVTDMEDEVIAQLVEDVEEVTAGQQQPQQPGFGATAARQAYNVACAASLMAAATAAAAAAHAMHAPTAGFESQAGTSGGAQESDQEALCYTPQPDVEDFGASLGMQRSWLHSVQEAAATTALDPAGSGFTQPPAAHTGGSHAPSPAGAAISPPTPAYTGAAAPASHHVPLPPLPPHVTRHEDTGADAAPAVCKDATASGPGMQPRTRAQVHVFHD
eukprot:XP_001692981.1 predicted protein [Chlamydomonas reinhardtii]